MLNARATKRYLRSSPRKMRLVIDLIRGKSAEQAIATLKFCPKSAAKDAEMVLRSAVSNLMEKALSANERVDEGKMYVSKVYVNQGPSIKRISPAPMGRAYRIRKRSHHLTIEVSVAQ
jgi:large subunit ribosomal protein L22